MGLAYQRRRMEWDGRKNYNFNEKIHPEDTQFWLLVEILVTKGEYIADKERDLCILSISWLRLFCFALYSVVHLFIIML